MALEFNIADIHFNEQKLDFLKIGPLAKSDEVTLSEFKASKSEKIDGLWGTLGWADDRPVLASGTIFFSENGTLAHRGVTKELAQFIRDQNPDIENLSDIRERFIDLSTCQFHDVPTRIKNEEEIHLRFELFLEKDEGALVYLQDNPKGIHNSIHSLVNFITPEPTKDFTQNRTSLSYHFAYSFGKEMEYNNETVILKDEPRIMVSVLKILTFKRKALPPQSYFKSAAEHLNTALVETVHAGLSVLGNKKYKLFRYDKSLNSSEKGGDFVEVTDPSRLDPQARTLFLFHGTFSSVEGSFGELCIPSIADNGKTISPFQKLLMDGVFEQIIGFNHPTASQSVDENVQAFYALLGDLKFTKPVDMITTSRGALVAETLLSSAQTNAYFTVGRMLTFAPAHGSDLLQVAKGLDRFLSILRGRTSSLGWGYIVALAQFSIKAIATQPGLKDMLPDSEKIKSILSATPNNAVSIQAMIGDFDKSLISKPLLRILTNGADALIRLAFKSETDWVIGCPEQKKRIQHSYAQYRPDFEMYCIHGMQFTIGHPKKGEREINMTEEIRNCFTAV